MAVFVYPAARDDAIAWPTLGEQVADWIEENLCYGPGDLLGVPIELDDEQRGWIMRMYEVQPAFHERRNGSVVVRDPNPKAGKRRFDRCALSLAKGSRKTEMAALIAIAELHPEAPVRCSGFTRTGELLQGCGVTDPYIPMIAYTEEQTEELAYGAARRILEESSVGADFDIGLARIMRKSGDGKMEAVAGSPNARDGARTTFEHADETHRFVLGKLKQAWTVMLANLAKRPIADPWALETTTAPEPGAGSVAETTMLHAKQLAAEQAPSRLYFFHREASDNHDLTSDAGLEAALIEARGAFVASWSDIPRIAARFKEPDADLAYLERVWTNRSVQASARAFDVQRWRELEAEFAVPPGSHITIGFDGSRYDDATALVGTRIDTGFQWPIGIWERPYHLQDWEVPIDEVDGAVRDAFERWNVVRMYCDPAKWESYVAAWAGMYGDKVVCEWWTNRRKPMAYALRAYDMAIRAGELSHSGDERLTQHIGNSCRHNTTLVDENDQPLWVLRKERPDSPQKIDGAMAGVLSWEACRDAITAGALRHIREPGDLGITVGNYG